MKATIKERIEQIKQGIVPEGYKKTEIGIIPEDWEVKKLGRIGNFYSGGTPLTTNNSYYCGNIPFIKSGEISNNFTEQFISEDGLKKSTAKLVKKGDLLLALYGATSGEVAISKIDGAINQAVLNIRTNENTYYLYSYFLMKKKYIINTYLQGGQGNLSGKIIKSLNFSFPPLKEQEKIASILTKWDSLIEQQEKLIGEKAERLKILTQELVNEKRRFSEFKEDWKRLKIEDFVIPVLREVKRPDEPYEALGIRSHCKGTFHKFVENPEEVAMDSLYKVKANDLIVNITFAWEHAIAIAIPEDEGRLVSHRFPTYELKEDKIDLDFLKALIKQEKVKYMLGLISPGGAGRNRVLNKKDFLKLEFKLPSLEEQKKIGKFISKLNEELLLQEEKLNLLKEEKKILMQLLLTGILRV